jgi:hypothetical protein
MSGTISENSHQEHPSLLSGWLCLVGPQKEEAVASRKQAVASRKSAEGASRSISVLKNAFFILEIDRVASRKYRWLMDANAW